MRSRAQAEAALCRAVLRHGIMQERWQKASFGPWRWLLGWRAEWWRARIRQLGKQWEQTL